MGTKKQRSKPYRARWNGDGVRLRARPHIVASVFGPMYAVIDELERDGTIAISPDGTPVYREVTDGKLYCLVSGVSGVIDAYAIHERRQGRDLDMAPLRQLINRIKYGTPITEIETKAARAALERMRAESMNMTVAYADTLLRDYRLKISIEAAA